MSQNNRLVERKKKNYSDYTKHLSGTYKRERDIYIYDYLNSFSKV